MKKKILFHGNVSKIHTGFAGHKRRIMRWFYKKGYEVVEACNGMNWDDENLRKLPWKAYGLNPTPEQQQQIASIQDAGQRDAAHRNASYGLYRIDEVVKIERPQIQVNFEDSWGFGDIPSRKWAKKLKPFFHCTIDSLGLMDSQLELACRAENLLVWASFAEEAYREKGYNHVKTLPGCIDPEEFYPISEEKRKELRQKFGLDDQFVVMFLGRNQIRKQIPNLLDGFKIFRDKNTEVKAKLLLHCSYAEGWPIPQLIKDKGIDPNDVLTTYFCKACGQYEIKPFVGQPLDCKYCGGQKSVESTNIVHGVSESQLCEIYGLADLVTNPISSGGFEFSSFQAKMCGKILSTTSYSCGLDACTEESAGISLAWEAYAEAGTCFIKSTTLPKSIYESMEKVFRMPAEERKTWEERARNFALNYCSTNAVCEKLEEMFLAMPEIVWEDSDFEPEAKNPDFVPDANLKEEDWLISVFDGMLKEKTDKNLNVITSWAEHLRKSNDYKGVLAHFRNIACQQNAQNGQKPIGLEEMLDKDDEGRRICIVAEQSAGDILILNSLIKRFKALYPEYNLYFFTRPEFFDFVEHLPEVHKVLPYFPALDNIFFLEGRDKHKGFFQAAFYPTSQSQKFLSYQHNDLEHRAEWEIK
jgi:glycosyltransferase involved in cell wall biosynthesis